MRRLGFLALAVAVGLAWAGPALSQTALPPGFTATAQRPVGQGVDLVQLERGGPNIDAYVARMNPGSPAVLKAVSAKNRIPHDNSGLEDPSDMCHRIHCTVALNADFHYPDDAPVGGVIADGRMLRSPNPAHAQLTVTNDGKLHTGPLEWSGGLRPSAGSLLAINGVNVQPDADDLVLFTRAWGDRTTVGGGVELVLTSPDAIGTVNTGTRVDLVGLRTGGGNQIPAGGAVLYASGAFIAPLQDLWNRAAAGTASRRADLRLDTALDAAQSVGTSPVLLHEGRKVFPDNVFAQTRHPRTLFGWNALGEVFMVAIDGRQRDSRGMNLNEASDFLLGLGATEGVNFDGGGGTTFVYENRVLNDPSDSSERAAVNILALVAPPVAAPPAEPAAGGGAVNPGDTGTAHPAGAGADSASATEISGLRTNAGAGAPEAADELGVLAAATPTLNSIAAFVGPSSSTTMLAGTVGKKAAKDKSKDKSGSKEKSKSKDNGKGTGKKGKKAKGGAGTGGDTPRLQSGSGSGDGRANGGEDQILAFGAGSMAEPSGARTGVAPAALALMGFALVAGLGAGGFARWRRYV